MKVEVARKTDVDGKALSGAQQPYGVLDIYGTSLKLNTKVDYLGVMTCGDDGYDWSKVSYNGKVGWVRSAHLSNSPYVRDPRYISADGVRLRSGHGLGYSVRYTLNWNTEVNYLGAKTWEDGYEWAKVEYKGYTGWVSAQYLRTSPGQVVRPASGLKVTTQNSVELRSGPEMGYSVVSTLDAGTPVNSLGEKAWSDDFDLQTQGTGCTWVKVEYNGITGWYMEPFKCQSYVGRSINQVVNGNYTDDVTLAGTIIRALPVIDLYADVQDLYYDYHDRPYYEGAKPAQTIIDIVAVLPLIGRLEEVADAGKALNKVDDAAELLTPTAKALGKTDEAAELLKYSDEVAEATKGTSKIWDYSKSFEKDLAGNFNGGYEIRYVIEEDMYLVSFHSGAKVGDGRSLKFWTTTDVANNIHTVEEYMDEMALLSRWGARDYVSVARIPAGTQVKYAIGTAAKKSAGIEIRPGGGLQILFEMFDESWILETRQLP